MITKYLCHICNREFNDNILCQLHEEVCGRYEKHICNMCGKEEILNIKDQWYIASKEAWHEINLGKMGYGSQLDGEVVDFKYCDNCLVNAVNIMKISPLSEK